MSELEYRVVSDKDGGERNWITEYDNMDDAKRRASDLNAKDGVPDDHHVVVAEVTA